ncbi:MAG: tetracycline resistance MFS efflux pump, partial [Candidatus Moranbacteria bacterium CG_4_9_14_3_um_filter_42_9]
MQLQKEKIIIISTVFVDVLGIGIIIPVLPFYLERFESGAMMLTALFSVFSLCSFLSAPVLGALSDRIGRRPVLLLSIFSTAVGWFVFASAGKIWVLFLGRIIDGMAAGNFPIAQSYLSDISKNEKERTANFGVIGAIFGIAFIVGPVFGSLLSS